MSLVPLWLSVTNMTLLYTEDYFQQNCNLRPQSRLIVRASPFAMGNEAQQNPPIMPWCPCTKRYSSDSGEISVSP